MAPSRAAAARHSAHRAPAASGPSPRRRRAQRARRCRFRHLGMRKAWSISPSSAGRASESRPSSAPRKVPPAGDSAPLPSRDSGPSPRGAASWTAVVRPSGFLMVRINTSKSMCCLNLEPEGARGVEGWRTKLFKGWERRIRVKPAIESLQAGA